MRTQIKTIYSYVLVLTTALVISGCGSSGSDNVIADSCNMTNDGLYEGEVASITVPGGSDGIIAIGENCEARFISGIDLNSLNTLAPVAAITPTIPIAPGGNGGSGGSPTCGITCGAVGGEVGGGDILDLLNNPPDTTIAYSARYRQVPASAIYNLEDWSELLQSDGNEALLDELCLILENNTDKTCEEDFDSLDIDEFLGPVLLGLDIEWYELQDIVIQQSVSSGTPELSIFSRVSLPPEANLIHLSILTESDSICCVIQDEPEQEQSAYISMVEIDESLLTPGAEELGLEAAVTGMAAGAELDIYELPVSTADLAGKWEDENSVTDFVLQEDGSFSGQGLDSACEYDGQITQIAAGKNLFSMNLNVVCPGADEGVASVYNGDYTGLAIAGFDEYDDTLVFQVSNGEYMLSETLYREYDPCAEPASIGPQCL